MFPGGGATMAVVSQDMPVDREVEQGEETMV